MSEDNPWQLKSSKLIYQNPWIHLREDEVIRPDGKPGIYGVVECQNIACGIIALDEENNIFLVGQYRYPMKEYSWEIIEGGCPFTETPLEAAKRELLEEAGLSAKEWQQIPGESHLSNCYSDERAVIFIARDLTQGEAQPDGTEVLKVKKVSFNDAVSMISKGEIKDAMSIMGILRARDILNIK